MSFVHLHTHTHYSILEGLAKPKEYARRAAELGMSAVAITDTSNIYGCHELYKACKDEGITPILGTEIFIKSSLNEKLNHKLVLLAQSLEGHQNIISLVSKANIENDGGQPHIQFEDLQEFSKDIVALSGPLSGEISYYLLSGQSEEKVVERIKKYQAVFGEENFYLELLYHKDIPKQQFVTDALIELHKKYGFPVVAANNCFYVHAEDKHTQDVIMALGTGHEKDNPDRKTLINGNYSFLTPDEMEVLFGHVPSAISNTQKIADSVDIEIETGGVLIPTYELPVNDQAIYERAKEQEKDEQHTQTLTSDEWYLRYLSFIGLNWRYNYGISAEVIFELVKKLDKPSLDKKLTETSPEELKALSLTYYTDKKKKLLQEFSQEIQNKIERLEYELVVVHEMGFDAYFLIVADYINWAREQDIPVGPGRGSAAGSLMAFLTGITDIDPLPYDLLFERFLNPARISMPDIDTDFADDGRDRVIEYCREKYGSEHVAQICTFGTFAARAAVKDVGRVYGIPFQEMNELAKLIPEKPGTKLAAALEESPEFKDAYDTNPQYKKIIDDALKIEGNVRQLGVHACAVIIAPEKMTNFTALQHPPKDSEAIVTQYSAYPLEDLGLLKMDFLGLRNLTIIQRTQHIVKRTKGKTFDMLAIDMADPKVFEVFAQGATTGVFQFESDGMRKYLKDLSPNSFEDLIAMVSLYRPGPLAYIPNYIDRKHGREEIMYMTPDLIEILQNQKVSEEEISAQKTLLEDDLKKILDKTYGIAVYQEQLMFIVQYMAGFSLGEADLLRRGVGKKKIEVIKKLKKEFIERSESFRGYHPKVSQYIYEEMIQPAANYSFNKSHAACYALISYQTAYLKAYYATEFFVSMMTSDEENMDRITLEVGEAESRGIRVLPPSVNESLKHFTYIDDENIRFGLKALKGIGDGPIDRILEIRESLGEKKFTTLEQFIEECGREVINKKSLEALILSGALDELAERGAMCHSIPAMIQFLKKDEKKKETNQIGLFDASDDYEEVLELDTEQYFDYESRLKGEKEVMGICISGHPLDGLTRYAARRESNMKIFRKKWEEIEEFQKKEEEKTGEKKKGRGDQVRAVGVIDSLRKVITKTGKNMLILYCQGIGYNFEVVVFDKDYAEYKDKVEEFKVIIVEGYGDLNLEFKRKTIRASGIKVASISRVREQARDLGLLDESRFHAVQVGEDLIPLEEKIPLQKIEEISEYIVNISKTTPKEVLHDLKRFLSLQTVGSIKIFLDFCGQKIDTKVCLENIMALKEWEREFL